MILKHEKLIQAITLSAVGLIAVAFIVAAIVDPSQFSNW